MYVILMVWPCVYLKMAISKHDCWNEMVTLNNKSPFVALMKTRIIQTVDSVHFNIRYIKVLFF